MNEQERAAWETVRAANRCWTGGEPKKLAEYFHENIVVITPSRNERLFGREACITDWTAYTERARVFSWKESGEDVRLFAGGETAVVTYLYEIRLEIEGEHYELKGRDMMTLVREDGRWWIAADQFSPLHEKPGLE